MNYNSKSEALLELMDRTYDKLDELAFYYKFFVWALAFYFGYSLLGPWLEGVL